MTAIMLRCDISVHPFEDAALIMIFDIYNIAHIHVSVALFS